jgi:nicotinamide-nucleotide amidase
MQRELTDAAEKLLGDLRARKLRVATAESCTGGLIAGYLTEVAGSSDVVDRGFVTYSNEAKAELLGVPMALITEKGAVSAEVARAMAEGALGVSRAQIAVAVTGVAGPGGGTPAKPVGLVYIATARQGRPTRAVEFQFGDIGRGMVRRRAIGAAFSMIKDVMD